MGPEFRVELSVECGAAQGAVDRGFSSYPSVDSNLSSSPRVLVPFGS